MKRLLRTLCLVFLLTWTAWAQSWVVGHRGGAALGAENSLKLFDQTAAMGVDGIEFDIHQSADGHLMVIHDVTLKRTFGVEGRVDRLSLAELVRHGVPTLQDAIDTIDGRCRLIIEVKHPKDGRHKGLEKRLLKLLKANNLVEKVLVISFDAETVKRLEELEPRLKTGFLYKTPQSPGDVKSKLGSDYVCPYFLLATPALIKEAHAQGMKVNAWTVNDEGAMESLIEAKCDAITTDYPHVLKKHIQREPVLP